MEGIVDDTDTTTTTTTIPPPTETDIVTPTDAMEQVPLEPAKEDEQHHNQLNESPIVKRASKTYGNAKKWRLESEDSDAEDIEQESNEVEMNDIIAPAAEVSEVSTTSDDDNAKGFRLELSSQAAEDDDMGNDDGDKATLSDNDDSAPIEKFSLGQFSLGKQDSMLEKDKEEVEEEDQDSLQDIANSKAHQRISRMKPRHTKKTLDSSAPSSPKANISTTTLPVTEPEPATTATNDMQEDENDSAPFLFDTQHENMTSTQLKEEATRDLQAKYGSLTSTHGGKSDALGDLFGDMSDDDDEDDDEDEDIRRLLKERKQERLAAGDTDEESDSDSNLTPVKKMKKVKRTVAESDDDEDDEKSDGSGKKNEEGGEDEDDNMSDIGSVGSEEAEFREWEKSQKEKESAKKSASKQDLLELHKESERLVRNTHVDLPLRWTGKFTIRNFLTDLGAIKKPAEPAKSHSAVAAATEDNSAENSQELSTDAPTTSQQPEKVKDALYKELMGDDDDDDEADDEQMTTTVDNGETSQTNETAVAENTDAMEEDEEIDRPPSPRAYLFDSVPLRPGKAGFSQPQSAKNTPQPSPLKAKIAVKADRYVASPTELIRVQAERRAMFLNAAQKEREEDDSESDSDVEIEIVGLKPTSQTSKSSKLTPIPPWKMFWGPPPKPGTVAPSVTERNKRLELLIEQQERDRIAKEEERIREMLERETHRRYGRQKKSKRDGKDDQNDNNDESDSDGDYNPKEDEQQEQDVTMDEETPTIADTMDMGFEPVQDGFAEPPNDDDMSHEVFELDPLSPSSSAKRNKSAANDDENEGIRDGARLVLGLPDDDENEDVGGKDRVLVPSTAVQLAQKAAAAAAAPSGSTDDDLGKWFVDSCIPANESQDQASNVFDKLRQQDDPKQGLDDIVFETQQPSLPQAESESTSLLRPEAYLAARKDANGATTNANGVDANKKVIKKTLPAADKAKKGSLIHFFAKQPVKPQRPTLNADGTLGEDEDDQIIKVHKRKQKIIAMDDEDDEDDVVYGGDNETASNEVSEEEEEEEDADEDGENDGNDDEGSDANEVTSNSTSGSGRTSPVDADTTVVATQGEGNNVVTDTTGYLLNGKKPEAKKKNIYLEEEAEEEEDEFMGLGGMNDGDEDEDPDNNKDLEGLVIADDKLDENVEAEKVGELHRQQIAEEDQQVIEQLMQDVTTGNLFRRRRGRNNAPNEKGFDILDSDDEELILKNMRKDKWDLLVDAWDLKNKSGKEEDFDSTLDKYAASTTTAAFAKVFEVDNHRDGFLSSDDEQEDEERTKLKGKKSKATKSVLLAGGTLRKPGTLARFGVGKFGKVQQPSKAAAAPVAVEKSEKRHFLGLQESDAEDEDNPYAGADMDEYDDEDSFIDDDEDLEDGYGGRGGIDDDEDDLDIDELLINGYPSQAEKENVEDDDQQNNRLKSAKSKRLEDVFDEEDDENDDGEEGDDEEGRERSRKRKSGQAGSRETSLARLNSAKKSKLRKLLGEDDEDDVDIMKMIRDRGAVKTTVSRQDNDIPTMGGMVGMTMTKGRMMRRTMMLQESKTLNITRSAGGGGFTGKTMGFRSTK